MAKNKMKKATETQGTTTEAPISQVVQKDGFNVAMKPDLIAQHIAQFGVQVAPSTTPQGQADALEKWFFDNRKVANDTKGRESDDLLQCDYCGGKSGPQTEGCPFCGTVDGAETLAGTAPTTPTTPEKRGPGRPKGPAKLALVSPPAVPAVPAATEKDLDDAVAAFLPLKAELGKNYWKVGQAIYHIYSNELWKQRTADGKPKYTGWNDFCLSELGMTHTTANKMADVSRLYTAEQVALIGSEKLSLVATAPESERPKLMEHVERVSTRDLKKEVSTIKQQAGHTRASRGKEMPQPKPKEKKITVAVVEGRRVISLYVKPARRNAKLDSLQKTVEANDAWSREEFKNDTKSFYRVFKDAEGFYCLEITTVREKAD